MSEVVVSFAPGDVVKPKGNYKPWCRPLSDGRYIISAAGTDNEYGINGCAWFSFHQWKLVHRATKESLRVARKMLESE